MTNYDALKAIEANITTSKALVDAGASLERLINNRDFKKVIVEGYLEKEAIRLVHLKADPSQQSVVSQASIVKQLDSIGSLKEHLRDVFIQADMALKSIASDEEMREVMQEEGDM
jgi:hypothetical protein